MKHPPPSSGGSYLRNPKTGVLTPNRPIEPATVPPADAKASEPEAPAKPAKSQANED